MTAYTNASKVATGLALSKFRQILTREGTFSTAQVGAVLEHVRREGCVTEHTPYVRPAEVEPLTALLIGCFEEVDIEDGAWDEDEGLWVPNDLHGAPEITDEERERFRAWIEDEYDSTPDQHWTRTPPIPPISGGAPDHDASFDEWLEYVDSLDYPPSNQTEEMRDWYDRHPLAQFNDDRTD